MSDALDTASNILLLHPPTYDPLPFLDRLLQSSNSISSEHDTVAESSDIGRPWRIDNKYYTADVRFLPVALSKGLDERLCAEYKDVAVLLYVFAGPIPSLIPPTIVKLLSEPRDVAIAIRAVSSNENEAQERPEASSLGITNNPEAEEMFEEVGVEFVDEVNPLTEEDDERPLEPLETIRQTLMTHLWPNMVRKPLSRSAIARDDHINDDHITPISPFSSHSSTKLPSTSFPIQFDSRSLFPAERGGESSGAAFPDLAELRAQVMAAQFEDIDRLDRLNGMENDEEEYVAAPGPEEYARLDDWLDNDDEEFEPSSLKEEAENAEDETIPDRSDWLDEEDEIYEPTSRSRDERANHEDLAGEEIPTGSGMRNVEGDWLDADDEVYDPIPSDLASSSRSASAARSPPEIRQGETGIEGFEDDFTEYHSASTSFQSRSRVTDNDNDGILAMDPTPLLMHLQSVRAELAGVKNEDERRVRAGREVAQILQSLGMGEEDLSLDLDMDLEFDDDELGI